jgi:hypothetical protein
MNLKAFLNLNILSFRNLLITDDKLKVGDIGICMSFDVVRKSINTLHYTPPEILIKGPDCEENKFKELYSTKSDIWYLTDAETCSIYKQAI